MKDNSVNNTIFLLQKKHLFLQYLSTYFELKVSKFGAFFVYFVWLPSDDLTNRNM